MIPEAEVATNPKVLEPTPTAEDDLAHMRDVEARVLAGAHERIHAEVVRAQQLGIIDEHGNLLSKEWPPEMQPLTASSTGAPVDLDDYDWRL